MNGPFRAVTCLACPFPGLTAWADRIGLSGRRSNLVLLRAEQRMLALARRFKISDQVENLVGRENVHEIPWHRRNLRGVTRSDVLHRQLDAVAREGVGLQDDLRCGLLDEPAGDDLARQRLDADILILL